ncbi:MAG: hypothetical protein V4467_05200 [Patescibacteria group bacterium]
MNPEKPTEPEQEYIVDGKIDWRTWVPYPEGFPEATRSLLDEVSKFTDLAKDITGSDDLEKFDRFTRIAMVRGLINKDEWLDIQMSKHRAC